MDEFGMRFRDNDLDRDRDSVHTFYESVERTKANRVSAISAITLEELVSLNSLNGLLGSKKYIYLTVI